MYRMALLSLDRERLRDELLEVYKIRTDIDRVDHWILESFSHVRNIKIKKQYI